MFELEDVCQIKAVVYPLSLYHVMNNHSGSQDSKCIGQSRSHINHFEWHPKIRSAFKFDCNSKQRQGPIKGTVLSLHSDPIITPHLLVYVPGQIKGACPIKIPCLVIGRQEFSLIVYFERVSDVALEAPSSNQRNWLGFGPHFVWYICEWRLKGKSTY